MLKGLLTELLNHIPGLVLWVMGATVYVPSVLEAVLEAARQKCMRYHT